MGKYGKKNVIKIDLLRYNHGIIGEPGIGKTTLAKEVCEKLVGEDGYLIANCGKEDGIDAISGAMYVDVPDYDVFDDFTQDVIDNKAEDYPDLKIIVWDSYDQLIDIFEPEVIRLWNEKQKQEKKPKFSDTMNGSWGGFMKADDKCIEMILDRLWELKRVGVAFFIIGHTKKKTKTDILSGEEYDVLTNNMKDRYFNAIKTKLHFLGVASIDRSIEQYETGKKNIVTREKEVKGKVTGAKRVITFRDDNYSVDSKSRFCDIVPQINLNADEYIEAVNDAIRAEASKDNSSKSIEERAVEQAEKQEQKVAEEIAKNEAEKLEAELEETIDTISVFYKKWHKTKPIKLKELLLAQKELGVTYNKISEMDNSLEEKVEVAKKLLVTIE